MHWKKNSFDIPFGKSGYEFASELSRLFSAFANAWSMEHIALKATVVMPILLLQKPHRRSKTKDHTRCLDYRMKLWKEGKLNDLVLEGRAIQGRLSVYHHSQGAKKNLQ